MSDDGLGDFPRDIFAERAALGCILLSPGALADCLDMLQAGDFARPAHQEIFEAIAAISARAEMADVITVKAELEHRGTCLCQRHPVALADPDGHRVEHDLRRELQVQGLGPEFAFQIVKRAP